MSNYAIWGLFGPATWPWWSAGAAMLLYLFPRSRRLSPWVGGAGFALFLVLAVLPTGYWLAEALEQRFPPPDLATSDVDHIVVLAGAERLAASARTGRPQVSSAAERIIEGARLARAFPQATLWIAGGVRDPRSPVADIGWTSRTWQELGIAPARIRLIDGTLDTCDNAEGFARQGTRGTALLVTSAMHMPRAVACFRAARRQILPYPVDFQNEATRSLGDLFNFSLLGNLTRADTAAHEWVGLLAYRMTGRIDELWPAPN